MHFRDRESYMCPLDRVCGRICDAPHPGSLGICGDDLRSEHMESRDARFYMRQRTGGL